MIKPAVPFVSCVITAHNRAAFLPAALDSALGQDFPPSEREIIVVDDGSTDDTAIVLGRYHGKIRVLRQANRGQGEATRAGILAASGEIIAALDSDDVWLPQKLSRVARAFRRHPDLVAVCHADQSVDEQLRPMEVRWAAPPLVEDRLFNLDSDSVLRFHPSKNAFAGILMCTSGSCWAVRKSALAATIERCAPPPRASDIFYAFLAMATGGKALRLAEPLALYRRHRGSVAFYPNVDADFDKKIRLRRWDVDAARRVLEVLDAARRPVLAADLRTIMMALTAEIAFLESAPPRPDAAAAQRS